MSNNISFEEAVSTLKVMFPDWDEDTLTTVLVSNNYHVERTIESVLTMSGDTNVNNAPPASEPMSNTVERQGINPSPARSISNESKDERTTNFSTAPSSGSRYRGRMCDLPDDFLRPPGYSPHIIADEELALMLQNEMFRREAQRVLGEDFNRAVRGSSSGNRSNTNPNQRRPSGTRRDSANQPVDLGIVKALSSMGSAAKKNLSSLAERFSQSNKANRNQEGREFKPLAGEEDEFEIISFDNKGSRNQHRMNPDTDEEFGYKNPLFQQHQTNDVNNR